MLRASRFVLNINYRQLSINYFIDFFRQLFVNVHSCSVRQIDVYHEIQFKNIVMHPVLIKSTNMAPTIGTIKKGFSV